MPLPHFLWLLLLPGVSVGAAAPDALSLKVAYTKMDAAYCRRDVPGIIALYAPGFTRIEDGHAQNQARVKQDLVDSFQGTRSVHAATRLKLLVFEKGRAKAGIVRRIDYTFPAPLAGVPPPYFVVEVYQEDWVKTPGGWRLKARREPPLVGKLRRLGERDQGIRRQVIADPKSAALAARMTVVDTADRAEIKQIIQRYGWPGFDLVGTAGADIAWGVVQHSDDDRAFQQHCLPLLREAVRRGQAQPSSLALLTDRILKAEGKPQQYGTQPVTDAQGRFVTPPTVDPAHLNQRRAAVGLPPMADYLKRMQQIYHPKSGE